MNTEKVTYHVYAEIQDYGSILTTCKDHVRDEPEGYIAAQEWAEKKLETHNQFRCGECGIWKIWRKK